MEDHPHVASKTKLNATLKTTSQTTLNDQHDNKTTCDQTCNAKKTKLKLTETTLDITTTLKTLSETHSNNTKTNTNQTNEQPQPQMNK